MDFAHASMHRWWTNLYTGLAAEGLFVTMDDRIDRVIDEPQEKERQNIFAKVIAFKIFFLNNLYRRKFFTVTMS